jgi:hypothetical protein
MRGNKTASCWQENSKGGGIEKRYIDILVTDQYKVGSRAQRKMERKRPEERGGKRRSSRKWQPRRILFFSVGRRYLGQLVLPAAAHTESVTECRDTGSPEWAGLRVGNLEHRLQTVESNCPGTPGNKCRVMPESGRKTK